MSNKLQRFDDVTFYDALDLADLLDIRASEVRERLKLDPRSLPVPLVFQGTGLVRWPMQQIVAWIKAGEPRDFQYLAVEFVPGSIARFHDPTALLATPTNPVSDPRVAASILDSEPAVEYPE